MTCVATQDETIEKVTSRLEGLSLSIHSRDKETLNKITDLWDIGVLEILDEGLTSETCLKMSRLLITSEEKAQRRVLDNGDLQDLYMFEGLKGIHDNMSLLVPEGMNEGQKPCKPYCC